MEMMSSCWNQVTRKPQLLSETGGKRDLQSLIEPHTPGDGGLSEAVHPNQLQKVQSFLRETRSQLGATSLKV